MQPSLDFKVPTRNSLAWISYLPGSGKLVGTGISITEVEGVDTPLNDGLSEQISRGALSFTTGKLIDRPNSNEWDFGAGPVDGMTVVGGISSLGVRRNSTLVMGQVENAKVVKVGRRLEVSASVLVDTVNSKLASHYGLAGGDHLMVGDFRHFLLCDDVASRLFFGAGVQSGNLNAAPLPEPSSLAIATLGGLGMIGFGLWRKSRGA